MALKNPSINDLLNEIQFTTSRSGGPGGQHVNKVNTKVTLRWDVNNSTFLDDTQRARILEKLTKVINLAGEVVISSQNMRSQLQNKEEVLYKLDKRLSKAFAVIKPRKPTKPTKASVKRRLGAKKKLSEKKKWRREM